MSLFSALISQDSWLGVLSGSLDCEQDRVQELEEEDEDDDESDDRRAAEGIASASPAAKAPMTAKAAVAVALDLSDSTASVAPSKFTPGNAFLLAVVDPSRAHAVSGRVVPCMQVLLICVAHTADVCAQLFCCCLCEEGYIRVDKMLDNLSAAGVYVRLNQCFTRSQMQPVVYPSHK